MIDITAALADADELTRQHRALEAIDRLQSAHRSQPDHRVACRLVELRHAAFEELSTQPGRPTWPVDHPDRFPGNDGIVEVLAGDLSGELLGSAIANHGCLRVNGLLDDATAARLRDRIQRAFEARDRVTEAGVPVESVAPWFVPYAPGRLKAEGFGRDHFVRVVDAPDALCDLV
ncbi:MAG: hypothetical protein JJE46_00585, partial [Acidimicrobiia bacterium]|nr:hypothetical protein [Acidimicrobiia bacterium]